MSITNSSTAGEASGFLRAPGDAAGAHADGDTHGALVGFLIALHDQVHLELVECIQGYDLGHDGLLFVVGR